jgi:Zn-dependent peptidase ImmA (M78 family)
LIEYEFHEESAGRYSSPKGSFVVAGLTDTKNRRIVVTPDCPTNQRRFTGAHELGHASLHSGRGVSIHRDKPIDHLRTLRTPEEWEADRFATYFLMPERLVRSEFKKRFLTDPFELTQDSAFGLSGVDGARLVRELTSRRKISRYLVQATSFNGSHFNSMAVYFRVSVEAMAIRLEELDLILTVVA